MNLFSLNSVVSLIICFLIAGTGAQSPDYLPDNVFVSCGSGGIHTAPDSREWIGDAHPRFTSLLQLEGGALTSSRGADPVPYRTARISRSKFSYTFRLKPGQKLIRLHFNSIPYWKNFQDLFSVEAGNFILLDQYSTLATANALGVKSLVKEFCVSVEEDKKLEILFSPEIDKYAFINGIEITSVPLDLSYFGSYIKVIGQNSLVHIDNSTVLEVIHRVHMKRDSPGDDSKDVFGMWGAGKNSAGKEINHMTWNVTVDVGFSYLVRLHFCDIGIKMADIRRMSFTVLINGMVATRKTDVSKESIYNGPWYGDRIVIFKGLKRQGTRDLSISLLSNSAFMNEYGPLKGFEIFKLSNTDNSLAGSNTKLKPGHLPTQVSHSFYVIGKKNSVATIAVTIVTLVNIVMHCLMKTWEANPAEEKRKPSARAARLCHRFSIAEIRAATRDFSHGLILGRGGFGIVYKGLIDNGQETVAMKRLKRDSRQGEREFWTEVETLSELRHVNLVSLIGYCCEKSELILVYEYMAGGTLADRLYKLDKLDADSSNHLSWQQRLRICIGAGRGLDYLHTGYGAIHRDVKASNILLDENLRAKIADFGLAKLNMISDELRSHVSTNVKGTFGYLDPSYISTHKLTQKSDTYAFGVVLLEILCGRPALDTKAEGDECSITKWARDMMNKGEADLMVDLSLREEIPPGSLNTYVEIVEECLHEEPKKRPTMAQVVLKLVSILEELENPRPPVPKEITISATDGHASTNVKAPEAVNSGALETSTSPKVVSPSIEQISMKRFNGDHPTGAKHEKETLMHKPARVWSLNSIWNRVTAFKRKQLTDQQPIGYPTSESRHGKHGKFSKYGDMPWQLSYSDLVAATHNFSSENEIGDGKFGAVYKGVQHDGGEIVVKAAWRTIDQMKKFPWSKLDFLCQIPLHKNLCRLIGFCKEGNEILLVSDYMANLSLFDHLHSRGNVEQSSSVINSWKIRIKIALGAAQGIDYLHRDLVCHIIHGSLCSLNILLDEDWTARVSNFGLSFMHPKYLIPGVLTEKGDVYSLGVVLLELLTGRRSAFQGPDDEPVNLVNYVVPLIKDGKLRYILDPRVGPRELNETKALEMMAKIAVRCVHAEDKERPPMRIIVLELTEALAVCEDRYDADSVESTMME